MHQRYKSNDNTKCLIKPVIMTCSQIKQKRIRKKNANQFSLEDVDAPHLKEFKSKEGGKIISSRESQSLAVKSMKKTEDIG